MANSKTVDTMDAPAWSTVTGLGEQVIRLWGRGELLRTVFDAECKNSESAVDPQTPLFPYRLTLKKPTSSQQSEYFVEVRDWIRSLDDLQYCRVVNRETRHRVLGRNTVPKEVWIDSVDDALARIGRTPGARQYRSQVQAVRAREYRLLLWVRQHPLKVLARANEWDRLLRVHQTMLLNPSPGIFLRQVSVPGVDSKFIESHRDLLSRWLDLTMPESKIATAHRGIRGFNKRYGYRDKTERLRLRSLDPSQPIIAVAGEPEDALRASLAQADLTLDVDSLMRLHPTHRWVLITENEINYLSLPDMTDTLALFGAGYGLHLMCKIEWLQSCDVFYWGDIDTHGLAILNELRASLPHARSILMDRDTLFAHRTLWGQEPEPAVRSLERLTDDEQELYQNLIKNSFGERVRLEQEQIDYSYVCRSLDLTINQV